MPDNIIPKSVRVLKVFTDKPGLVIYKDDIVNATKMEEWDVRVTVANLRNTGRNSQTTDHPGKYIDIVERGQAWIYRPNTPRTHEEVKQMVSSTPGGQQPISKPVLDFLTKKAGETLHLSDIVEGTGLRKDQVLRALSHLKTKGLKNHIKTVLVGAAWIYYPKGIPEDKKQEVISMPPAASVKTYTAVATAPVDESWEGFTKALRGEDDEKDHVVVTHTESGGLHVYGPFTRKEAQRLSQRHEFKPRGGFVFMRKLIDRNEKDVNPSGPRG